MIPVSRGKFFHPLGPADDRFKEDYDDIAENDDGDNDDDDK